MIQPLAQLYRRDLIKVISELEAYPDEGSLWQVWGDVANPGGTLALHLIGNLNEFVGRQLGGLPYTRDRDEEFGRRDVRRSELLVGLRDTLSRVEDTFSRLDEAALEQPCLFSLPDLPSDMTTGYLLLSLYGHLNWHLGQLTYHRRMIGEG